MRLSSASQTCDFKVVYLGSNLALSTAQFDALARIAGPTNTTVNELPPTDDGEKTRMVRLAWPVKLSRAPAGFTAALFLFQAPTNERYARTRAALLQGADFMVMTADTTAPVVESTRWMDELIHMQSLEHVYYGARKAGPPLVIQYLGPEARGAKLREQIDPAKEFGALFFEGRDPAAMAKETIELVVQRLQMFA